MRVSLALALTLLTLAPAAQAADPPPALAGDWDGSIAVGAQTLPLTLHLRSAPNPGATMDSPRQGMNAQVVEIGGDAQTVTVTLTQAGAVFTLKPSPDGQTLAGALAQNGAVLPITFIRRTPGAPAPVLAATPSPSMAVDETAVQISGPLGAIKGTLTLTPGPPKAIAVIIQGSGPVDRDGNSGPALKAATSKLLAQALAAKGIESIRSDKRGMFASGAAIADPNKVTIEEYAQDARDFAALAARRAGLPCAWLIGHSEGSLVALQAAQQPAGICGVVSISGPGRNLGEVLRSQIAANVAAAPPERKAQAQAQMAQAGAAITRLQAGRRVDTTAMDEGLLGLFAPVVQDFVIDEFHYSPPALVAAYKGPVLVLQGDADLQVSVEDADKLAAARSGVRKVILPGVNHVLKASPPERVINQATYADPSLPLAPGVAAAIIDFITAPPQ